MREMALRIRDRLQLKGIYIVDKSTGRIFAIFLARET